MTARSRLVWERGRQRKPEWGTEESRQDGGSTERIRVAPSILRNHSILTVRREAFPSHLVSSSRCTFVSRTVPSFNSLVVIMTTEGQSLLSGISTASFYGSQRQPRRATLPRRPGTPISRKPSSFSSPSRINKPLLSLNNTIDEVKKLKSIVYQTSPLSPTRPSSNKLWRDWREEKVRAANSRPASVPLVGNRLVHCAKARKPLFTDAVMEKMDETEASSHAQVDERAASDVTILVINQDEVSSPEVIEAANQRPRKDEHDLHHETSSNEKDVFTNEDDHETLSEYLPPTPTLTEDEIAVITSTTETTTAVDNSSLIFQEFEYQDAQEKVKSTVAPVPFKNLGNTCYMNSILQPLFNSTSLYHSIENIMDQTSLPTDRRIAPVTFSFLELWNSYMNERERLQKDTLENGVVDKTSRSASLLEDQLRELKREVGQISESFLSSSQQDTAEFVDIILDTITDEFKKFSPLNPIKQTFSIELREKSTCTVCGHITSFPPVVSNSLYVNIPEESELNSLQTLIDLHFQKQERREWKCDQDGCPGHESDVTVFVRRLPQLLLIQLGRYTILGEKIHTRIKAQETILLPKESKNIVAKTPVKESGRSNVLLDLNVSENPSTPPHAPPPHHTMITPVLDQLTITPPSSPDGDQADEENKENSSLHVNNLKQEIPNAVQEGVRYHLRGVVCHHGMTRHLGHYFSYVKGIKDNLWYHCDDDDINEVFIEKVWKGSLETGYVFFFERDVD